MNRGAATISAAALAAGILVGADTSAAYATCVTRTSVGGHTGMHDVRAAFRLNYYVHKCTKDSRYWVQPHSLVTTWSSLDNTAEWCDSGIGNWRSLKFDVYIKDQTGANWSTSVHMACTQQLGHIKTLWVRDDAPPFHATGFDHLNPPLVKVNITQDVQFEPDRTSTLVRRMTKVGN